MLYPNGQRVLTYPGRHMAGALAASGAMAYGGLRGARFNRNVSETYSKVIGAVPAGYGVSAAIMSVKRGGLAGFAGLSITPAATGGLGLPGSGSTSITFTVADADGQLISSGSGAASLTFTVADALLLASLGGQGSAAMAFTTNAPLLGAIADGSGAAVFAITPAAAQAYPLNDAPPLCTGVASFAITGALTPYAVGRMSGSTVDTSVLTSTAIAAAVWDSVAAQFADSSTFGGKLNTASSGGVDLVALAQAVRAELATELARLDVRVGTRASQADVFAA